ncbi:hypothetical protein D9M73_178830 [compost metagenome]
MRFVVDQVGKCVIVVVVGSYRLADPGHGRCFVKTRVAQVTNFELGFVFVQLFGLRLDFARRWGKAGVQLAGQVTDLILAVSGRGEFVDVAQPHPQLQQRCRDEAPQAQAHGQGQGQ